MEYLVAMRTTDLQLHATLCVKSHKHDAEQEKSNMKEHLCICVLIHTDSVFPKYKKTTTKVDLW